jgi:hypothetical protein
MVLMSSIDIMVMFRLLLVGMGENEKVVRLCEESRLHRDVVAISEWVSPCLPEIASLRSQ